MYVCVVCVVCVCMYVCMYVFIVQISNTDVSDSLAVSTPKLITATPVGMVPIFVDFTVCTGCCNLLLVFTSRSVELLALQLELWVLQFCGRETWTVNERSAQEMGATCMVILRPLLDLEILDRQRWPWRPNQTENRQCGRRFESTSERLVTSLETNGRDSTVRIGSPIPALGKMKRRTT